MLRAISDGTVSHGPVGQNRSFFRYHSLLESPVLMLRSMLCCMLRAMLRSMLRFMLPSMLLAMFRFRSHNKTFFAFKTNIIGQNGKLKVRSKNKTIIFIRLQNETNYRYESS